VGRSGGSAKQLLRALKEWNNQVVSRALKEWNNQVVSAYLTISFAQLQLRVPDVKCPESVKQPGCFSVFDHKLRPAAAPSPWRHVTWKCENNLVVSAYLTISFAQLQPVRIEPAWSEQKLEETNMKLSFWPLCQWLMSDK